MVYQHDELQTHIKIVVGSIYESYSFYESEAERTISSIKKNYLFYCLRELDEARNCFESSLKPFCYSVKIEKMKKTDSILCNANKITFNDPTYGGFIRSNIRYSRRSLKWLIEKFESENIKKS